MRCLHESHLFTLLHKVFPAYVCHDSRGQCVSHDVHHRPETVPEMHTNRFSSEYPGIKRLGYIGNTGDWPMMMNIDHDEFQKWGFFFPLGKLG